MKNPEFSAMSLIHLRREQGYSAYKLAKLAGINLNTLLRIEDESTKNPGINTILQLCAVLKVNIYEVIK